MKLRGKVFRFGDNVSTDVHLSVKYRPPDTTLEELKRDAFKELDPDFSSKVRPGDVVVGGENFGLVSSRADAAVVLRELGVSCVLAKSFGHMFYRNAINMGLPVVECDTEIFRAADQIEVDLERGVVEVDDERVEFSPYPPALMDMVNAGGLIAYLKNASDFPG